MTSLHTIAVRYALLVLFAVGLLGCQSSGEDAAKKETEKQTATDTLSGGGDEDTTVSEPAPQEPQGLTEAETAALKQQFEEEAASSITLENALEAAEALEAELDAELDAD